MQSLVRVAKVIRIFRKGLVLPNAVEAVLFRQRIRRRVNLAHGLWGGACNFIWANADERAVFLMEFSLDDVHVSSPEVVDHPESRDRCPEGSGDVLERVEESCVCDPCQGVAREAERGVAQQSCVVRHTGQANCEFRATEVTEDGNAITFMASALMHPA
jgi:hypothetical protein